MRELELIERLERGAGAASRRRARGRCAGSATTPPWCGAAGYAVTSVDTVVDGVHFRSGQLTPAEIGHRALGSALSDLAAMGARAGEAYLALVPARGHRTGATPSRCLAGAQELADECGVTDRRRRRQRLAGADA